MSASRIVRPSFLKQVQNPEEKGQGKKDLGEPTANSELELRVAEEIETLAKNPEIKKDFAPLTITRVKEIAKSIVVFFPAKDLAIFKKVEKRLVRELEKKFSDRHVFLVADRRILAKPGRKVNLKQPRPRTRTLASVHDAYLEDIVAPAQIEGKRRRISDGKTTYTIILDSKTYPEVEYKIKSAEEVYKALTGKKASFDAQPAAVEAQ